MCVCTVYPFKGSRMCDVDWRGKKGATRLDEGERPTLALNATVQFLKMCIRKFGANSLHEDRYTLKRRAKGEINFNHNFPFYLRLLGILIFIYTRCYNRFFFFLLLSSSLRDFFNLRQKRERERKKTSTKGKGKKTRLNVRLRNGFNIKLFKIPFNSR